MAGHAVNIFSRAFRAEIKNQKQDTHMKLSEAYPSAFLKADDLQGRAVTVTIAGVKLEDIGQGADKDKKLVLSFAGKEKKFVCNKTNAGTIAKIHGDDTDYWIDQSIVLVPREVEYQGEMVWAIRVSLQKPTTPGKMAAARPPPPVQQDVEEDSIPF